MIAADARDTRASAELAPIFPFFLSTNDARAAFLYRQDR
jgi:hypothetical protein